MPWRTGSVLFNDILNMTFICVSTSRFSAPNFVAIRQIRKILGPFEFSKF